MSFYIACHFTLRGNITQLERDTAGVIKEERKRGETASICWPPLRAPKRPGIPKSYDVCDRSKGYNHSLWERSHHGIQTVSSHPTKGYLFSTLKKNTKRPLNQNWIRLSSSDELKKKCRTSKISSWPRRSNCDVTLEKPRLKSSVSVKPG